MQKYQSFGILNNENVILFDFWLKLQKKLTFFWPCVARFNFFLFYFTIRICPKAALTTRLPQGMIIISEINNFNQCLHVANLKIHEKCKDLKGSHLEHML